MKFVCLDLGGSVECSEAHFSPDSGHLLPYVPRMEQAKHLHELFRMQKALNERFGARSGELDGEEKTKRLLNYL
jgi:hypothetical protein